MPDFRRQLGLCHPDQMGSVTCIGAGHIGSHIVAVLAEMGVSQLSVYDGDTVEEHNVPASFYGPTQIGFPKTKALSENVQLISGMDIECHGYYRREQIFSDIIISSLDSIEERRREWEAWKQDNLIPQTEVLIDCRVGADTINIYFVNLECEEDVENYETSLYDTEFQELQCSMRSVAYNARTVSGFVGGLVKCYFMGQREFIPFRMELDHKTWFYEIRGGLLGK